MKTGNSPSALYTGLVWLLLIIASAVLVGLMASALSWRGLVTFLEIALPIVIAISIGGALVQRTAARKASDSWLALAHSTGLTYEPDDHSLLGNRYPGVRGEYRGYPLFMTFAFQEINTDDISVSYAYPRFSLEVNNRANIWLDIRPKGLFVRAALIDAVSSGNEKFSRLFAVRGRPENYKNAVIRRIAAAGPHILECLRRNVSLIELNGSNLVCSQGRTLSIDDQIALFNLMCDLADEAGKIRSEEATYSQVSQN